jgi:hypothetical protein
MKECNQFSLRAHPRLVVYQGYSSSSAAVERRFEIADIEANVMYSGAATRHEFPNRRIVVYGLEQLDERPARIEAADSRSVHRRELSGIHAKDVPVEGKHISDRADRNANVGNSDALGG